MKPVTEYGADSKAEVARREDQAEQRKLLPEGVAVVEVKAAPDARVIARKVGRHLLPLYCCVSVMSQMDRVNLSLAALQLNADLHFSPTVYGFGSGVFFLGYACFHIPAALLCTRLGAPVFLGVAVSGWGIIASSFAAVHHAVPFCILRFLLGLFESGSYPAMWYHMSLFYDDAELNLAYAMIITAAMVNGMIGSPVAALLLSMDGWLGLRGWQWLFLVEGMPAVALGLALWWHLAPSPASATFLSSEEREWLLSRRKQGVMPGQAQQGTSNNKASKHWWDCARDWRLWYLALLLALVCAALDGLIYWLPTLIQALLYAKPASPDADEAQAPTMAASPSHSIVPVLLSAIPWSAAAVATLAVGAHSKATRERHWHGAVPLATAAVSLAVLAWLLTSVPWLAFCCMVLALAGVESINGPTWTWPAVLLDKEFAVMGLAMVKTLSSLGSFIGPFIIGWASHRLHSYAPALLLLSAALAIAAVQHLTLPEPGTSWAWTKWLGTRVRFKASDDSEHELMSTNSNIDKLDELERDAAAGTPTRQVQAPLSLQRRGSSKSRELPPWPSD